MPASTNDFVQHDLIVRAQLLWDTVLTGSIQNVLDGNPSDAPSLYNYDYTNGNPLGRVFAVNVKKRLRKEQGGALPSPR